MNAFPHGLCEVLQELARFPYENLSKVSADCERISLSPALESPDFFYHRAVRDGLGGTCFSMTHYLKKRLESIGIQSAYLIGDKHPLLNIHCGLIWEWQEKKYLLDPGYLIFSPILLPTVANSADSYSAPMKIRVDATDFGWHLYTGIGFQGNLKPRFCFRYKPVEEIDFFRFWTESYSWPMMQYPVISQVKNSTHYYLQKNNLYIRSETGSVHKKLNRETFALEIEKHFNLKADFVQNSLAAFERKGKTFFS